MTIHKEFIDQIIFRREAVLGQLLGEDGLKLKSTAKNVDDLVDPLDRIFYTIDFLQKERLIDRESGYNVGTDLFGLPVGQDYEKVYATMHLYDLWKDAGSWKIKAKPGLVHFKQQGYQTDSQIKEKKQFWLTIAIALLASAVTAVLTAWLTKPPIFNCWGII
jgi:hypothetical protein